ncbi:AAA family ATPase [Tautonia sp. JC769]|uniref:AAA family ATPase n=1 Tax=Tautonia sp. JC769 TaxID=3232135 RepID=UPI00345A6E5F
MIERVRIENFKALREIELDLGQLTVIVGPNSSGKSSILEAIHAACQRIPPNDPDHDSVDPYVIRYVNSEGSIRVICGGMGGAWTFSLNPPERHAHSKVEPFPWDSSIEFQGDQPFSMTSALFRFEADTLAMSSRSDRFPPLLPRNGYGLASVLAYMALNRPDDFSWVQRTIRTIVPAVRRIRFDRKVTVGPAPYPLDVLVFDMESGDNIEAAATSEGTLLTLGILAAVAGCRGRDSILLVDDLDRGLHPRAQHELINALRFFLEENPSVQLVATTHSPILLNYLRPEEVRLTSLNPDGTTACARMTDHPDFEEWKDSMAPGEFWSYVGEQWVRDLPIGKGSA